MPIFPEPLDLAKQYLKKKRKTKLEEAREEINKSIPASSIQPISKPSLQEQYQTEAIPKSRTGTSYIDPITRDYVTEEQYEKSKALVASGQYQTKGIAEQQQLQQQQLGQVGQFEQLPLSEAPLQDVEQGLTQGVIGAIPRALSFAVTGAGVGAGVGGVAGAGVGALPGAAIGATAGFVSGIASSMISEFKGQRTDTINEQKRTLDEGKQNLNDWATMAAADPANAPTYISRYNQQLAVIDQAYRQMKYDTQRDLGKFEKALPDLAEFEAFYSVGGERDVTDLKLRTGLTQQASIEYEMLELANRRGKL